MKDKLMGKYVFFDVDGTLAEYRYEDKIYGGKCPELGCQSLENLLYSDLFLKARPLKNMQKLVSELDANRIFVLGAITTNNEMEQKIIWLNNNYLNIPKEHFYFINSTMLKPDVIIEFCKHYNVDISEVVFVDDRLDVLRRAEEMGICSYHPSSFVE